MTRPTVPARTTRGRGPRPLGVLAAALLVVALGGCAGSDEGQGPATPTAAATTASSATTGSPAASSAASAPSTASSPAADVVLSYTIAHGKATPGFSQVEVATGQTVSITVTSDVADEVHVHGYDKELELRPGTAASVSFTADQTGQFEIETHESGLRLAALVVR